MDGVLLFSMWYWCVEPIVVETNCWVGTGTTKKNKSNIGITEIRVLLPTTTYPELILKFKTSGLIVVYTFPHHLFNFPGNPATLEITSLWTNPRVAALFLDLDTDENADDI